jgi:hypothetical protein
VALFGHYVCFTTELALIVSLVRKIRVVERNALPQTARKSLESYKSSGTPSTSNLWCLAVPCIFDRISGQNTAGCSARRRIGVLEAVVMQDFTVPKMILRELVTTVLSTEIVDSQNVPNGTDLRQGVSAAYSNENERADIKTVVLSSLSAVRCRNREYL